MVKYLLNKLMGEFLRSVDEIDMEVDFELEKPISAEMIPLESESQRMIYPSRLKLVVTERRFLRPNLSESLPKTSPPRNIPIE